MGAATNFRPVDFVAMEITVPLTLRERLALIPGDLREIAAVGLLRLGCFVRGHHDLIGERRRHPDEPKAYWSSSDRQQYREVCETCYQATPWSDV